MFMRLSDTGLTKRKTKKTTLSPSKSDVAVDVDDRQRRAIYVNVHAVYTRRTAICRRPRGGHETVSAGRHVDVLAVDTRRPRGGHETDSGGHETVSGGHETVSASDM